MSEKLTEDEHDKRAREIVDSWWISPTKLSATVAAALRELARERDEARDWNDRLKALLREWRGPHWPDP